MSPLLHRLLKPGHPRLFRCTLHARVIRCISSTGRLQDAPIPKLKAEADVPHAEANGFDPFDVLLTRQRPALLRPIIFTLGVGICTFTAATYLSRRESQELAQKTTNADASVGELRNERIMLEVAQARKTWDWLSERGIPEPVRWCYAWLATRWVNYSDGERVGVGLIAANAIVFLAWQVPLPAMRFFMVKHFMHHPLSGRSYTLLTSVFSHMNFLHFGVNMVAMQSFVRESSWYIGSAQSLDPDFRGIRDPEVFTLTSPNFTYHVLAFFLTAGVFSMFGSHASAAFRLVRAQKRIPDVSKARNAVRPSLGASGAVYGTLVLTALAMPDVSIQLFFLPFLAAPIRWGAAGLMTMDTVGILRGWKVLDHYGHLSGAAFGGAYFFGGPYLWARTGQLVSSKTSSSLQD